MAAAGRLAVDGHERARCRGRPGAGFHRLGRGRGGHRGLDPAHDGGLEGDRVQGGEDAAEGGEDAAEGGEDAAEGVVGGDATGQGQEGAQPGVLGPAEGRHVDPGIGARRRRAPRTPPP